MKVRSQETGEDTKINFADLKSQSFYANDYAVYRLNFNSLFAA